MVRLLFIVVFHFCTIAAFASTVQLASESTIWNIEPDNLRISATVDSIDTMVVFKGFSDVSSITLLKKRETSVSWSMPDRKLKFELSIYKDNGLQCSIHSDIYQNVSIPLVPLLREKDQLIWAKGAGCIFSLSDPFWHSEILSMEWDTLESLSIPAWGVSRSDLLLSAFVDIPFRNTIKFVQESTIDQMVFSHDFNEKSQNKSLTMYFHLDKNVSPIQPAFYYRDWLQETNQFISLNEKAKKAPGVERLRGSIHAYLWGGDLVSIHDILPKQWKSFCSKLVDESNDNPGSIAAFIKKSFSDEQWQLVIETSSNQWSHRYAKNQIALGLSDFLDSEQCTEIPAWKTIPLPEKVRALYDNRKILSLGERYLLHCSLLASAFPGVFREPRDWGNGVSLQMLQKITDAKIDRIRLCTDGWEGIERRPFVATQTDELGWLIGTYDSYHSIHDIKYKGTDNSWSTAQMTQNLFENGSVQNRNGQYRKGFKGIGRKLNSIVGRPYVEKRIRKVMNATPFNYYFMDCDAWGEVYDDFHPDHPMSMEEDAAARCSRLEWITDTFNAVVGSEGGNAYSVNSLHVVEGVFGPLFGWGDSDMRDKSSKYYTGRYYPADAPEIMFKPIPIKERYIKLNYDLSHRLPLYTTVYHDAVIATHHWGNSHFKYPAIRHMVALTEVLYLCPPMYHFNLDEFDTRKNIVLEHYQVWSPLHRAYGFTPMTDFQWLTQDRLVQQTKFGNDCRIIVNFKMSPYKNNEISIPPYSAWIDTPSVWDRPHIYTPTKE
jgi:hypothetical protein